MRYTAPSPQDNPTQHIYINQLTGLPYVDPSQTYMGPRPTALVARIIARYNQQEGQK